MTRNTWLPLALFAALLTVLPATAATARAQVVPAVYRAADTAVVTTATPVRYYQPYRGYYGSYNRPYGNYSPYRGYGPRYYGAYRYPAYGYGNYGYSYASPYSLGYRFPGARNYGYYGGYGYARPGFSYGRRW